MNLNFFTIVSCETRAILMLIIDFAYVIDMNKKILCIKGTKQHK